MFMLQAISIFTFVAICLCGLVIVIANHYARRSGVQEVLDVTSNVVRYDEPSTTFHAHHALSGASIHAIKDHAKRLRAELVQCDLALCVLFDVDPNDGSDRYDEIVQAVHCGEGWPKLISDHNLKIYGSRWPASTRRAHYSV